MNFTQIIPGYLHTFGIKTISIDYRAIFWQAEQARLEIARLRERGNRANLGKAKTKTIPNPSSHSVFVEPSRQTNGLRKTTTKQHLLQAQVATL